MRSKYISVKLLIDEITRLFDDRTISKTDMLEVFRCIEEVEHRWVGAREIKVGDNVEVINGGLAYTTYPRWVAKNVSDKVLAASYRYGSQIGGHTIGVVKAIAPNENNGDTLYYIDTEDGCVLIGDGGVRPLFEN